MRKTTFLLLLLAHSLYITAQEFDEAYLESLPEEMREDIQKKIDEQT